MLLDIQMPKLTGLEVLELGELADIFRLVMGEEGALPAEEVE